MRLTTASVYGCIAMALAQEMALRRAHPHDVCSTVPPRQPCCAVLLLNGRLVTSMRCVGAPSNRALQHKLWHALRACDRFLMLHDAP